MTAIWLLQAASPIDEIGSGNSELLHYVKVVVALAFIVALAFVVLQVALPKLTGARRLASGAIQVAARYPLEPKKNLYVIRVGPDYFLVGTTESRMHYLTALDAGHIELALETEASAERDFPAFIKNFRRRKDSSEETA